MLKRTFIVLSLTLALTIGVAPTRAVHGNLMTESEVAMLDATPDQTDADANSGTDKGNAFVRALKAPFKAIGRIFGIGRKDDNKLHRLSEKDVKKFETASVLRVVDARAVAPAPTAVAQAEPAPATPAPATAEEANAALARQNLENGRALLNAGNVNEAISAFTAATSLDPKLKEAYNLLGVAYESKGLRDRAFKALQVAVKGDKVDPEHLNNLGYLYFKNGEYDSAAKYLKRAVRLAPNEQRFWNNLGLTEVQRGKFDEAYNCFQRAVGEFEGHMNVANRLQAMGYEKEAIKHLELARAIQPNSREILVRLIALYRRTGRTEQAEEARTTFVSLTTVASAPGK